jgi:hypothetical protein
LPLNHRGFLLVNEQILLRADHVEITHQPADVARVRNVQLAAGRGHCFGLRFTRRLQDLQSGNVVLNFAKRIQHGVPITGDRGVVASLRELHLGSARATSENGLRDIRADSPYRRLRIE